MQKPALNALTSVRFFAAMMVLAYHFSINNAGLMPNFIYLIVQRGALAVIFFYVLSGFILAYNYLDRPVDPKPFWVARFARIYPVFFFALLLSLPAFLAHSQGSHSPWYTSFVLLCETALIQAWLPIYNDYANGTGWSISVEMFFYIIFPYLGVYLAKASEKKRWGFTIFIWAVTLGVEIPLWLLQNKATDLGFKQMLGNFSAFTPIFNLSAFMVGILAGITFLKRENPRSSVHTSLIITGIEIGLIGIMLWGIAYLNLPSPVRRYGFSIPIFALIIYVLALGQGLVAKVISRPILLVLGEASYALYILQLPVAYWIRALFKVTSLEARGPLLYAAIYVPALIGLSLFSFFVLERPLRVLIRSQLLKYLTTTQYQGDQRPSSRKI